MERLGGIVPTTYRQEMVRVARRLRDRLPPVVIARRIDALERHIDRRFKEMAAKLDELSRRVGSGAA
jgi:hypothetical protein